VTDGPRIVQFPHPGGEHVPGSDDMAWNQQPGHKRKYLTARGRTVDPAGAATAEGQLVCWGEWEPPSRVVHRWAPSPDLPTVVHEPFWTSPGPPGGRQNTDPWVFGRSFLYSNCKQAVRGAPTAMQRLPRGSLILFGSTVGGRFLLDTVFVVGRAECRWTPNDDPAIGDRAFRESTVRSLAWSDCGVWTFTLYRGATPDQPVGGLFSWVPCRLRSGDDWPRFQRPELVLPDVVSPANRRSTWGANHPRSHAEVRDVWEQVVAQAEHQGMSLGCGLHTPPARPAPAGAAAARGSVTCAPPRPGRKRSAVEKATRC
jgi:hypothetical protein